MVVFGQVNTMGLAMDLASTELKRRSFEVESRIVVIP